MRKKLDRKGYDLIKKMEGLKLDAYLDNAVPPVWTIGWGNTQYEDFKPVKQGDKVSLERAQQIFKFFADRFAIKVDEMVEGAVNQTQFNVLVSFAYNVGLTALKNSTLLRKVNANPSDQTIRKEFMRWVNSGGKVNNGLRNRRKIEADLYFSKEFLV